MSVLYLVALVGVAAILVAGTLEAVAAVAKKPVWFDRPRDDVALTVPQPGRRPAAVANAEPQRVVVVDAEAQPVRLAPRRRASPAIAASPSSIGIISLRSGTAETLSMPSR